MPAPTKTMPWWSSKTDPTGAHLFFALLEEARRRGYADEAARAAWAKRTGDPCPFHTTKPTPKKAYLIMASTAYLDLETRSTYDLADVGVERYVEDPQTDILCFCYALDDGPIQSWSRGQSFPDDLRAHLAAGGIIQAHNAGFERWMWTVGVRKHQFPGIAPEQWDCSMAACAAMAFPQALDGAAKAYGGPDLKDDEGRRLMLKLCKPAGKTGEFIEPSEDQLARLIDYCRADVAAQRGLWSSGLLPLPPAERQVWLDTQRMNDTGVRVDLLAAEGLLRLLSWSEKNIDILVGQTVGRSLNVRSPTEVKGWLQSRGIQRETLDKNDVLALLSIKELPGDVRVVLEARQQMSKSSTAKVRGMVERACHDGRLRGNFKYHGATTGRWAGSGVQLQNLPKGNLESDAADEALVDAIEVAEGRMSEQDWSMLWGDPFTVCPSLIRGLLIPGDGKTFVCADYSAIEGRVLAWLAGEEHVLDAYRKGLRLYCVAAAGVFKEPYEAINNGRKSDAKYKKMDAVGKVIELACGYQGSTSAFRSMETSMGMNTGLTDDEVKAAVGAWRESRPKTVALWRALEREALQAARTPGYVGTVGLTRLRHDGTHLWMRLPSGRKLCYPFARVRVMDKGWGDKETLTAMAINSVTKKWGEDDYYGGKLCENLVQAVSRDIMAEAFTRVSGGGELTPLALVHDEILCETLDNAGALQTLIRTMTQLPTWANPALPLAAEGWVGKRYCK